MKTKKALPKLPFTSPKNADERIANAVVFLRAVDGKAPVTAMMDFLEKKGLSTTEILEAMNQVTNGALVKSAFGV